MALWKGKKRGVVAIVVALSLLVTACASGGGPGTGASPSSPASNEAPRQGEEPPVKAEPFPLKMMAQYFDAEPPSEDNPIMKAIGEYTNTEISVTWVPNTNYADVLNATLAARDHPHIMLLPNIKLPSIVSAARSGMFWDLAPYLQDYPNLSQINEVMLTNISIDGKVFGIPRPRVLARKGAVIRKDWLDKVGLDVPANIDELYEVIRAFTRDDPDGNGVNDTYGLLQSTNIDFSFSTMVAYFGGVNQWGYVDGKVIPDHMTEEYMNALDFYKRLYDEGLMNRDFAVTNLQQQQQLFHTGKGGIFFGVVDDAGVGKMQDLYKLNPAAEVDVFSRIEGPQGVRIPAETGHAGMLAVPVTSVKSEAELKVILDFFDKMWDEEIQDLLEWGIEGEHFVMEDGEPTRQGTHSEVFGRIVNPIRQLGVSDYNQAMKGKRDAITEKYKQMEQDNIPFIVPDVTTPLLSDTFTELGSELTSIIDNARVQYITGAIDRAEWDRQVERWLNTGGQKVIDEFTEQYEASRS